MQPRFTIAVILSVSLIIFGAVGFLHAQTDVPSVRLKYDSNTGLPVVYAYHGMLLNHDLSVIRPTDRNKQAVLEAFHTALLDNAPQALSSQFDALRERTAHLRKRGKKSEVRTDAALTYWLLDRLPNQQKRIHSDKLRSIEAWAGLGTRPEKRAKLYEQTGVAKFSPLAPTPDHVPPKAAAVDYVTLCRKGSVPIPPDWGSSEWRLVGTLDPKFNFVGDPSNITEVWTYVDPTVEGTCIALPRRDGTTKEIQLLGIICQSYRTGKACFWDNIDKTTEQRVTGSAAEQFRIADIQDGSSLAENCTNCHRGYNAFMIHPGTALDIGVTHKIDPLVRYAPISGQASWGNPPALIEMGLRPCANCHDIPALQESNGKDQTMPSAYCQILEQAANLTMPSINKPASWTAPDAFNAPHVNLLREQCSGDLLSTDSR